jgi:PAS domain S-box-containing protein
VSGLFDPLRARIGRSPTAQRRLAEGVVGLIGIYSGVFHVLHIWRQYGDSSPLALAIVGLTFAIGFLLMPAAYYLRTREPEFALAVAGWTVLGFLTFVVAGTFIRLYQAEHGVHVVHPFYYTVSLSTGGAAVGYLLGILGSERTRAGIELRLFHSRLTEEQRRFEALFTNLQNPCLYFEMQGGQPVFRSVNPAFEDVFGYASEEVVHRPVNDVIVPTGYETGAIEIDILLQRGESIHREVRRRTADGVRDFLLHAVPLHSTEPVTGFALVIDITERKQQLSRLEVLNRVLRHDLRNGTNVILGYAELLAEETDDPRAEKIYDNAADLVELGNTVRQVEETFHPGRTPERFAVGKLARAAVSEAREAHPDARISVAVMAEWTLPANELLDVAIEEVIDNAVEHNDHDRSTVTVSVEEDTADYVRICIEDDGPGLPPLERAVLKNGSETQVSHSRGLGLWLVRWVVEDSGGELVVEDRKPRGTAVSLRLPRA